MSQFHLLRAIIIGAMISAGSLAPTIATAAAPMVKKSAPAYYRMMLGDFEITALSDGTVNLPMDKLLKNSSVDATNKAFEKYYLKSPIEIP